ncbi:uncharacterized protein RSE6_10622 [Rhynchosporium secalis]|uniref:Uncharacterized protein n=1 Tax=Rhynchosporium secalis TaxID=38038 RepID=A0A1E1MKZ1_RHYSE|nr:uncharacterized protein RSE6_10622 [Rhynchosporium secalis]
MFSVSLSLSLFVCRCLMTSAQLKRPSKYRSVKTLSCILIIATQACINIPGFSACWSYPHSSPTAVYTLNTSSSLENPAYQYSGTHRVTYIPRPDILPQTIRRFTHQTTLLSTFQRAKDVVVQNGSSRPSLTYQTCDRAVKLHTYLSLPQHTILVCYGATYVIIGWVSTIPTPCIKTFSPGAGCVPVPVPVRVLERLRAGELPTCLSAILFPEPEIRKRSLKGRDSSLRDELR